MDIKMEIDRREEVSFSPSENTRATPSHSSSHHEAALTSSIRRKVNDRRTAKPNQPTSASFPASASASASASFPASASASASASSPTWPRVRHQQWIKTSHLLLFVFLTCCLSFTSASIYIPESMVEVDDRPQIPVLGPDDLQNALDRLARSGTILVDPRPAPRPLPANPHAWTLATENDDLKLKARRGNDQLLQRRGANQFNDYREIIPRDESSSSASSDRSSTSSMITTATVPSSSSAAVTKTAAKGSATSSTSTTTTTSLAVETSAASTTLPSPFDQGFAGNITESCSDFMYGFLTNATFKACLPFSMLLQNSNSFFQAAKSSLRITQLLDHTCAANLSTCSSLMTSLASNLTTATSCASDLTNSNPLILSALSALNAYEPLYTASCLRNPSTNAYCFADAITNASSPTDSYIYYLPLNISLPGSSRPTCNTCLQNTMGVFEAASANRSSALASDYVAAAQQVNVICGPNFVASTLPPAEGAAVPLMSGGLTGNGLMALGVLVAAWLM